MTSWKPSTVGCGCVTRPEGAVTAGSVTVPMWCSPEGGGAGRGVCAAARGNLPWISGYNVKKRHLEATLIRVKIGPPVARRNDPPRQPSGRRVHLRAPAEEHRPAPPRQGRLRGAHGAPRRRGLPQGRRPALPGRTRNGAVLRDRGGPQARGREPRGQGDDPALRQ